jgi:outer membrane biosynthesis protein TonB
VPDSVPDAMSDDLPNVEPARAAAAAAEEANFEICVVCSWFRHGGPAWFLDEVWDKSCNMHGSFCLIRKMPDEDINGLVLGDLVLHPPPLRCLAMSRIDMLRSGPPKDAKKEEKKNIDPVINHGPLYCYEMSRIELLRQRDECECPPKDAKNEEKKKKEKKKKKKKNKEKKNKEKKNEKKKEKKKNKEKYVDPVIHHAPISCFDQSRIEMLRDWAACDAECADILGAV